MWMDISTAFKFADKNLHYFLSQLCQAVTESINKPVISKSDGQQQN